MESLSEVAARIARREVSCVEVVGEALSAIERSEPAARCFVTVDGDGALRRAAALDARSAAGLSCGPLHGVPVSVKDCVATSGLRTTAGSPVLGDWVPTHDAEVVRRLDRAGAVLVGKANMYEFGYGFPHPEFGVTPNPWDETRMTGGSSSGSAAAVARGLCHGSIGTDAAGSVRIPASFCGVVGFKPTYGRVSTAGIVGGSFSLDTVGPLARSVKDVALLAGAIADTDLGAPAVGGFAGMRLGVVSLSGVDPAVRETVEGVYSAVSSAGAELVEVDLPDPELARTIVHAIFAPEFAEIHRELAGAHASRYSAALRSAIVSSERIPASVYVRAQRHRRALGEQLRDAFRGLDAVLTPTTPITAYPIADLSGNRSGDLEALLVAKTRFTVPFSLTGQPAVSVPCGLTDGGLPVGLQVVGDPNADGHVLRIARLVEALVARLPAPRAVGGE